MSFAYKRVVVKISGEALAGDKKTGFDFDFISHVCSVIKGCVDDGAQVGIVIGGGNFWRGVKNGEGYIERSRADHMGMLATAMNCMAMADVLEQKGVDVRVQTALEIKEVAEPYIRQSVKGDFDIAAIAGLLQARCEKLTEIPEKVDFFDTCPEYGIDFFTNKKSKTNPEVCKTMLEAAIPMLEQLPDWTTDAIHDSLIALAEQLGVKNATLMWPVRIAAAGKLVTPGGAVEICHLLGKDETLRRLRLGLDKLN